MSDLATRGAIGDRPWGTTLAAIAAQRGTVELTVDGGGKHFTIGFVGGAVVAASSPLAADSVARIALTSHLVSSTHVAELARRIAAAPGRDQILLLADLVKLAPAQVELLRGRVITQCAARTFAVEAGSYAIASGVPTPAGSGVAVDVRAILYHGARLNLSELRLATELRAFGSHFALRADAIDDVPRFGFTDDERPILVALRAGATVPELEARYREIDPRTLHAVVYALACTGGLRCSGSAATPAAPAQDRTPTPNRIVTQAPLAVKRTVDDAAVARTPTAPAVARTPTAAPVARTPTDPAVARTPTDPAVARTPTAAAVARTPTEPRLGITRPPMTAVADSTARATTTPTTPPPPTARTATTPTTPPPLAARTPTTPPPLAARTPTTPPLTVRTPTTPTTPPPLTARTPTAPPLTVRTPTTQTTPPLTVRTPTTQTTPPLTVRTPTTQTTPPPLTARTPTTPPLTVRTPTTPTTPPPLTARTPTTPPLTVRTPTTQTTPPLTVRTPTTQTTPPLTVRTPTTQTTPPLTARTQTTPPLTARTQTTPPLTARTQTTPPLTARTQTTPPLTARTQTTPPLTARTPTPNDPIAKQLAAEAFARGERALRADDVEAAVVELARACELVPSEIDYATLLGWARFCAAPDRAAVADDTRRVLERGIQRSPQPERARFYLGRVERMLGRDKEALRHFYEVLALDPADAATASEIRVLEARLAANTRR